MADKKKIIWLLILQGWAMLWVVIGHAPIGGIGEGPEWENVLYSFAYSFHMPLFILVSGWLFHFTRLNTNKTGGGKWDYKNVVYDKALRLLLPGVVFSFIAFAVKIAFPGEISRQTGFNFQEIVYAFLYPYENPLRELWFIATLFQLFLLMPLWRWILSKRNLMWGALLVLAILHFFHPSIELFCIGKVLAYAIWFYLGLIISKEKYVDKVMIKQPWITLFTGIALYILGRSTNSFVTILGGITFSFGFALIADKYVPKLFCSFRNYTYQIFLMGIFAQIAVKIAYRHISIPYMTAYILCILVGLYVPILVSKVIEKINWKFLLICVGLKPQKNK